MLKIILDISSKIFCSYKKFKSSEYRYQYFIYNLRNQYPNKLIYKIRVANLKWYQKKIEGEGCSFKFGKYIVIISRTNLKSDKVTNWSEKKKKLRFEKTI